MSDSICPHCRKACSTLSAGHICCADCSSTEQCAACTVPYQKYQLEFFGPDGICPVCLPGVVADALDEDYVPSESESSETETEGSESEASDAEA